jgi:hypothetical protein
MLSETIFLEDVPERDREVLRQFPAELRGMRMARPPRPWLLAGSGCVVLAFSFWCIAGSAGLSVAVTAGLATALPNVPSPLMEIFFWGIFAAISALSVYGNIRFWTKQDRPVHIARKLARRHHGRYFTPTDFDEVTGEMAERAQLAVNAVLNSHVYRDGHLDTIANQVILDDILNHLARTLFEQTTLRAENEEASKAAHTPELTAILTPQRKALTQVTRKLETQIKALERYADRVAQAESIYTAARLIQNNDRYEALLAQVHDTTGLADLSSQTHNSQTALTAALHAATQAGQALRP